MIRIDRPALSLAALVLAGVTSANVSSASPATALPPPIWTDKLDVIAFDRQVDQHLAAARASIQKMLAVQGERTVDNTLHPFDEAILSVNNAFYLATVMEWVHPNAGMREHAAAANVRVTTARSEIQLDPAVYRALSSLDTTGADSPTQYYVKRQLLLFRLAGVDKNEKTRDELKRLNDRLTELVTAYDRNISDDVRKVIASPSELVGMPPDYLAKHPPGPDGKVTLTTAYPDAYPLLTYAESLELRRRMIDAFESRGYPKNEAVLREMLAARERVASLLGYANWADYYAADKMAGSGARIGEFISALAATSQPAAEREYAMLLTEKRKRQPDATALEEADFGYLRELVRRASYNFDSQSVRPYFAYERVKQGILDITSALFQVSFERERNVAAWDPSVETWLVRDRGAVIGRIYLDMHPRDGKFTHAAMSQLLDGVSGRQLPEAVLVCNFPAPTPSDPGLMTYSDVSMMFHEFGHLLHHVLAGRQRWAGISGISMESDFQEAPSQMLEELLHSADLLAGFARHYQTGAPIPPELVQSMNRAYAFGRGMRVGNQLALTAASFELHRMPAAGVQPDAVWQEVSLRYSKIAPQPGTHGWASLGHLGGYSSAYYTYLWDQVIALDFFTQFNADRPLSGDAGMRYRKAVLEPGGSLPANDLVKNFLGRPQDPAVMRRWIEEAYTPAR